MVFLRRFSLTRHQTPLIYQTIQFRQILGGGGMNNCRLKRWVELHIIQNGLNGFLRGDWFRKNRIEFICSSNEYWFKKFPRLLSQSRQLSKESFGPKGNSGLVCQQPPLLLVQDFLHVIRESYHIASFFGIPLELNSLNISKEYSAFVWCWPLPLLPEARSLQQSCPLSAALKFVIHINFRLKIFCHRHLTC